MGTETQPDVHTYGPEARPQVQPRTPATATQEEIDTARENMRAIVERHYEDCVYIARGATGAVAARFGEFVTRDDLISECLLWCVTHPHKLVEWLERDDRADLASGRNSLRRTFAREAELWARREKARVLGYSVDDEYFYSPALVTELVRAVYRGDTAAPPADASDGSPRPGMDPAEGNNWLALVADTRAALARLDPDLSYWLSVTIGDDESPEKLAAIHNCSPRTVRRWRDRALRTVVNHLGGPNPAG